MANKVKTAATKKTAVKKRKFKKRIPKSFGGYKNGEKLNDNQISRILYLLKNPEISMPVIAKRIGCSRSTVNKLSLMHGIRNYNGKAVAQAKGREQQTS